MAFINLHLLFQNGLDTTLAHEALDRAFGQGTLPIRVEWEQKLASLPSTVNVASCDWQIGEELRDFYENNYPDVNQRVIVVFVLNSIIGTRTFFGCSRHPTGMPGTVLAQRALADDLQYTLAHEIGHLLSLGHAGNTSQLMFEDTSALTADPPLLTEDEQSRMRQSRLVIPEADDNDVRWFLVGGAPDFRFLTQRLGVAALPVLERMVRGGETEDTDILHRCRAAHAAALYGSDGLEILRLATLPHQPSVLRRDATRAIALTTSQEPAGRPLLEALTTDADRRVKSVATRQLKRINGL